MIARRIRLIGLAFAAAIAFLAAAAAPSARAAQRIGDLTVHPGDVPKRLVGYGLVVGLDGTGDRSFGGPSSATPTVRSVVNLLRRFDIQVPAGQLRLRNVAAVLVTAEVSPYLRAGGRFEVSVSAIGDASSLRGGVLWMTPLITDPGQPPLATAQGALFVPSDEDSRSAWSKRSNSGRIAEGGVLEVDSPRSPSDGSKLLLREPDLATASRIADAVNAAFGAGVAKVEDPGVVGLTSARVQSDSSASFLAAIDTVLVMQREASRIVISAREGTIVAGGDARVGNAVVSHRGITLAIGGGAASAEEKASGMVRVAHDASVEDVAAGLHAAGARPEEIAAIFEALRAAGALGAQVVIR